MLYIQKKVGTSFIITTPQGEDIIIQVSEVTGTRATIGLSLSPEFNIDFNNTENTT